MTGVSAAERAVERAARDAYAKLLATIAARTGDIARAEDALADALETALRVWPEAGVPDNPEAWLTTAAKRRLIDHARRDQVAARKQEDILTLMERSTDDPVSQWPVPDPRLRLLLVCAHPAIDANIRAPLMLQTVLGLRAEDIAALFLVSPTGMAQQLVRAKKKIQSAKIPFSFPDTTEVEKRLNDVLDAIYGAFSTALDQRRPGLIEETVYLAALCSALAPTSGEARGLLALCLYRYARFGAARDAAGEFVPLDEQNPDDWDSDALKRADTVLRKGPDGNTPGRYQLEAAIQSAHIHGITTDTDVAGIVVNLYERLLSVAPSTGAHVGFAGAVLQKGDPHTALNILDDIEPQPEKYQPYWATRAAIERALGNPHKAAACYDKAIALTTDEAVKRWLAHQADMPN